MRKRNVVRINGKDGIAVEMDDLLWTHLSIYGIRCLKGDAYKVREQRWDGYAAEMVRIRNKYKKYPRYAKK